VVQGPAAKPIWPELDHSIAVRFIDTSQALLAVVTSDGALTWANDSWHDQLGWTAEAMAELSVTGLLHHDDVSPFRGALLYLAEIEDATVVAARALTASGDPVWLSWHLASLGGGLVAVSGRNIDEAVRGKVRAVDQSRFLRSVLDAFDAAIAIIDSSGRIVETYGHWSRADGVSACGVGAPVGTDYLALCSNDADACGAAGAGVGDDGGGTGGDQEAVWSEQAPEVGRAVAEVLTRRRADAVVEYSLWHPDGQEWFEARVSPLRLADGQAGCVVAHIDITARVTAEREAATRTVEAEMLSLVARYTNNPVVISDVAGRMLWVNDAFTRLTGSSLESMKGRLRASLVLDDEARSVMEAGFLEGTGYQVELTGQSAAGRRYWVDVEARPIGADGQLPGFIEVQTDITSRKRVERRLAEERALLREIMAGVPFAVYWKDQESRFLGANVAMADLAGLSHPDDIKGLTDADLPWGALAEEHWADDTEVLTSGQPMLNQAATLEVAGGATRHIMASRVPLWNDGEIEGLIGVFNDVTEQKEIEAQLAHTNKLESIGQLAAGVAHEINTPTQYVGDNLHFLDQSLGDLFPLLAQARELAGAVATGTSSADDGTAYLAADDAAEVDYLAEDLPQAVTQSLSGIERVTRIVAAMKEFTHPGEDALTPVDLNRAVESSIAVSTNEWKYVADVVTDLADDLPLVPGIAGELSQVFVNLIVNGAHAVAEAQETHGDGLPAGDQKGTITVSTRAVGDHAEVRIADSGTGIPEDIRDRVFDHFFTTKDVGRGTGQGLSLAHGVVATKHGGTIDFETELGVGTTFIIRLPLGTDEPADVSA
jgi:PAS domain S-box-containing protein